jgi:hypothetical protein
MHHETLGKIEASDDSGNWCTISIGKERNRPSNFVSGVIKIGNNLEMVKLQDTCLGHLDFDGVRYWDPRHVQPYAILFCRF